MRGGKPGYFPPFGGPVPDLVFGRAGITRASAETNAKRLNVEVNNGRLAMIGLFGFLAEANCPGAVPGLTGLIKPCLLYTSPSPRDGLLSRMPSSA